MNTLSGKKIVLGISGGIAAYKTPELVRRLKEHGADIRVVMTQSAQAFITPLTLQAVSGHSVCDSLLDTQAELAMGHIELAKWGDIILIAPTTANMMAKISHGIADDLLSTLCLATSSPLVIAPAMNQQMWHAAATQNNLALLKSRQVTIMGPGSGEQACGDIGLGRMLDVDDLVTHVCEFFNNTATQIPPSTNNAVNLKGQHWVITAGPTREAIDPVRYISNHSSGKMGYAIAQAALSAGAKVTLISGPVNLEPLTHCNMLHVNSAQEMHTAALTHACNASVFVACAAVADYRIDNIATQKIKKSGENIQLNLVKNPDIVANVAQLDPKPYTVGFAAETQDVESYALGKLKNKKLDMIAANNVAISGQGFNADDNALTVYDGKNQTELPLTNKAQLAENLIALIAKKVTL